MQPWDYMHKAGNSGLTVDNYVNRQIAGSSAIASNKIAAQPFFVGDENLRLGTLGVRVTASGTGLVKLGIFSNISTTNIYPNALLQSFGEFAFGSTGNIVSVLQDVTLTNGLYWIVNMMDSGSGSFSIPNSSSNEDAFPGGPLGIYAPNYNQSIQGWQKNYTYLDGMPSTFPVGATPEVAYSFFPAILIQPY